jgi:hypothetical protein
LQELSLRQEHLEPREHFQPVDADAQKFEKAKRVRVQFGSPEYFDLQKKNPKAQAWLAVGNNVQFVLDGTVYEVFE